MKVQWSTGARADLARIHAFNLGRSESWAVRVDLRLKERGEALGRAPFMGRAFGPIGLRALSIPDIQYILVYRVRAAQVTILRAHNTRENREAE